MAGGRGPRVPYRTVLTAYWALLVALGLVYFVVPWSGQTAVGTVSILINAAAVAFGVVRNRPARAAAWLLLGAALVTAAAANLTYDLLPGPAGGVKTAMYVVNVLYLATFAFNIAGLLRLARQEQSRVDWASVIDAVILTLGLVLLVWIFLVVPLGRVISVTQAGRLAPMAYPIVDVLLLLVTARFFSAVGRTVSAALVTAGMVGLVIYHLVLVVGLLRGVLSWHTPADLLWLIGHGLLGTAALHPSMRRVVPVPAARPPEASPVRLVLLAVAALIPPAIMIWESTTGLVIHNVWVMTASVAVLVLVLARLGSAVYRLRQQSAREHDLRAATAALVAAADLDDVEAALDDAVRRLLPAGVPYRLLLAPPESDELAVAGAGVLDKGIVDTAALPSSIAARLAGARQALVYPLVKGEGVEVPRRWHLIVGVEESGLVPLRVPLATLAAATTLALERIRLSQEVIKHASEAYFRTLVQNAADIILVLDDNDRVRYATPSAATVFGHRDLRGVRLADLIEEAEPSATPASGPTLGEAGREWKAHDESGRVALVEASVRDMRDDASIRGRVITLHDVTERRRLEQELTRQAFHDPLTGLANRALFSRRSQEAITAGGRGVTGVLLIDLDEFKLINDALGHDAGDVYLVAVGERLRGALPPGGVAARIGGDEFAALVVDAPDVSAVDQVAAGVATVLSQPVRLNSELLACGASIGVATTADAGSRSELMHHADLALYAAKESGKGRFRHYQPAMHTSILRRLELRSALERALSDDALTMEYQPIVRLLEGDVIGYEALLRWQHPTRGLLPPADFIDAAEESGLIVPIGDWVLRTAITTAAQWRSVAPGRTWYVSVNASARQFQAGGFVERVRAELALAGLPASQLMLEITESLLLGDDDRVWRELHELRSVGVRLAIDDFGTGYSALSSLRQMPLDVIKIDRLFTRSISTSPRQFALFRGIVGLAHTLGLTVVVEGVESQQERDLAIEAGCTFGQGFLFARPMPAAEVGRGLAATDFAA